MPTYNYRCEKCEHAWEDFLSMADYEKPTKEPCPQCGVTEVRKVIGGMPGIGVDATLTPDKATGGDWSELMGRMKKVAGAKGRRKLDASGDHSGRRWNQ